MDKHDAASATPSPYYNVTGTAVAGPVQGRVFVISLARATERRETFSQTAPDGDLPWEFFDACESLSPDLRYNETDALIRNGRTMHPRELACYSSHYSVWKKIADENIPQALIVEDDAIVDWGLVKRLFACNLAEEGLHYLKLYNNRPVKFRILDEMFLGKCLIRFSGYAHGMVAYAVTQEGAAQLVERLQDVYRPVDDEIDRDWHHGLPNLAIFPQPAFEKVGTSTIGYDRFEEAPLPRALFVRRQLYRVREKLSRWFLSSARRRVRLRSGWR
ncbi:glycosyltransferase family 25 protein [Peteryoungia ipomoeae]|uniref:Glycosyltransferase family 25 protein n=1 Tax=Peteryoungia ipomoeae TaxID=1210932 RepID=A0A4S8P9L3_9HYPH|nr:glycosyltransferase family 25 protein [Peteryoungia ipomoeae]THV25792.1 glycosyltransferase family 25 protein [Peteryoungia ipomoeae]